MAKHIYIAKQAKGLKFRVTVDDKDVVVRFKDGQFSTEDDELAAQIDAALQKSTIRRFCQKADRTAALKLAAEHQAMLKRTGAHKGGITAGAMKDAMNTELNRRDAELHDAAGDSIKEQFAEKESLVLTEAVDVMAQPEQPTKLKFGVK